jgi:hypothetical protein
LEARSPTNSGRVRQPLLGTSPPLRLTTRSFVNYRWASHLFGVPLATPVGLPEIERAFDDGVMRDAQVLDRRPPGSRRVEARHPWVWIRYRGAWRTGAIHCWFVDRDTWIAWMQHDPADPDNPQAVWGLYVYDGATIRRRNHPEGRARVEGGPDRLAEFRDLGYAVLRESGSILLGLSLHVDGRCSGWGATAAEGTGGPMPRLARVPIRPAWRREATRPRGPLGCPCGWRPRYGLGRKTGGPAPPSGRGPRR